MSNGDHYLRRELYDLLREDPDIFDFLQKGSLDGIWYWDLETGNDEWMSPEFWTLLGFDPEEKQHLASEWQDLIFPEDLQVALENFQKHCEDSSHPYDQVVRYRHQDGSTVWVRCRGIVIRDAAGKPVRMLGAHTDLTPQKKVEQELAEKNRQLEALNGELRNALNEIRTLRGLLPICSHCKRIRSGEGLWTRVEAYLAQHTGATFTHGLCPECIRSLHPDEADTILDVMNSSDTG